ncbi:MAG: HlyD family secretion protein [Muribaculaceae bacterium]
MLNRKTKKLIYNLVIIAVLIAAMVWVVSRFWHYGNVEWTDNAQVRQHIVPQNCRVSGFVKEIRFEEYAQVHKGDTLLIIDDAEMRLRLAQAEADLANARAGITVTESAINTTSSNVGVNEASIDEAKAQLEGAERDEKRYATLLARDAVTREQYDNINTRYLALKARYEQMLRQRRSTTLVKNEQTNRLAQNQAAIRLAEAAVDLARLNLSYTVIVATCDGVTGRKNINVGQLVQPGQTVVNLVDSTQKWVVANYRETQMRNVQPGAQVSITVDAVPGVKLKGRVSTISDATGAQYSLMPQDNATGNFVKVEQRVPVRIELEDVEPDVWSRLCAGMNVECEVKY